MIAWEQIEVGDEPLPRTVGPVSRTDIVRYQGASGDMNPIHHDEPFAARAGFDRPLGVGMLPAGAMHAWLASWLGPDRVRLARTRFKATYFPGDTLDFTAKVTGKREEDGRRLVDVESACTNQDGAVTMLGWATFEF